jgi:hypothetical protein
MPINNARSLISFSGTLDSNRDESSMIVNVWCSEVIEASVIMLQSMGSGCSDSPHSIVAGSDKCWHFPASSRACQKHISPAEATCQWANRIPADEILACSLCPLNRVYPKTVRRSISKRLPPSLTCACSLRSRFFPQCGPLMAV